MWCYLVIAIFDWKIDVFQKTVVRVYCILKCWQWNKLRRWKFNISLKWNKLRRLDKLPRNEAEIFKVFFNF